MANNQNVNKVVINNAAVIDLTADTVDAAHLLQGYTAHDKSGAAITGTATAGAEVESVALVGDAYALPDFEWRTGNVVIRDSDGTYRSWSFVARFQGVFSSLIGFRSIEARDTTVTETNGNTTASGGPLVELATEYGERPVSVERVYNGTASASPHGWATAMKCAIGEDRIDIPAPSQYIEAQTVAYTELITNFDCGAQFSSEKYEFRTRGGDVVASPVVYASSVTAATIISAAIGSISTSYVGSANGPGVEITYSDETTEKKRVDADEGTEY